MFDINDIWTIMSIDHLLKSEMDMECYEKRKMLKIKLIFHKKKMFRVLSIVIMNILANGGGWGGGGVRGEDVMSFISIL